MTDLNPIQVSRLISRIRDVERCYGTLTSKTLLSGPDDGPMIFKPDLELFKQIVENNVMADPLFRSPKGYEVLNFLTMLCLMQDADRERVDREQRAEMNALFLMMPKEAQDQFKAWLKKPHFQLSDTQTFQMFNNQ